MAVIAKPVLGFLNNMYVSGETEEPAEREVASTVKGTTISAAIREGKATFKATLPMRAAQTQVSVQYKAKKDDIERIRKHLKKSWMSATMIGKHTFEYFLERECGK